jgi:hypothetical protein
LGYSTAIDTDGTRFVAGVQFYHGTVDDIGGVVTSYIIPPIITQMGSAKVQFNVKGGTVRKNITQTIISDVKALHPSGTTFSVASTESATVPTSLYNEVNNASLFETSLAKARGCYPDCTITVDAGSRRVLDSRELQSGGTVPITISFDLTEAAYNTLVASGNQLDDQGFIDDLATELGVNASSVSVTVVDGEVVVSIAYEVEEGSTPTGEDTIADFQEIQASLNNATQVLVDELGEPTDSVTLITLDLCGGRDCNSRGTCDTETGLCDCTGNWWGINCETACTCNNGGECKDKLCHCEYPYYDLRCDTDKSVECNACS